MFKLVHKASYSLVGAEKSTLPDKSRFIQLFLLSILQYNIINCYSAEESHLLEITKTPKHF